MLRNSIALMLLILIVAGTISIAYLANTARFNTRSQHLRSDSYQRDNNPSVLSTSRSGSENEALVSERATALNTVRLQGNTLPIVASGRAHPMGHHLQPYVESSQEVRFLVGLALKNQTGLDAFLEAVYDPRSPSYHRFLTPEQFVDLYSPTSDQYNAVSSWLSSSGFVIEATYPNRLIIEVSGSVAKVEDTFNIQINTYNYSGQVFFANGIDPQVPAQFNGMIRSIIGLDNFLVFTPHVTRAASSEGDPTYTPQQILKAYNIQPLIGAGYKGTGQSIAIATAYNYYTSDVRIFESEFGLPQNALINIPVGGSSVPYSPNGSFETTLDVEWSSAVAQGATIRIYMGVDPSFSRFTSIYNQIVVDNVASVMSTSWGKCEPNMPLASISQDHFIFQQAAAQGIAIFAASGDYGAYDCGGDTLAVDFPASDPYVTAVGGTSLSLTPSNSYSSETAWSGSGGGISSYFGKPSWQIGILPLSGTSARGVPDVAYDSDLNTGQWVRFNGTWSIGGGTSIAAPEWAGIAAIWTQYGGSSNRLGCANPLLYNLGVINQPKYFHDVVSGNNGYYGASTGWDYVTGWGSPDVCNLVATSKIVFSSTRDGSEEIYVMNANGSGQTRLTYNSIEDNYPALSPDGSKIAFARVVSNNYNIFVMNSDGSGVTQLTSHPLADASDNWPVWSHDSSKIMFIRNKNALNNIFIMNSDGSGATQVTNDAMLIGNKADWSPDGSKIVFTSYRDGNDKIFTMNADSSNQVQLTFNTLGDEWPAWSPDGSKIAFSRRLGPNNNEIYVMNADGSASTRLTTTTSWNDYPAWSPDGSKITFYSIRDGNAEIYTMNSDGSSPVRLTNNPAVDAYPSWHFSAAVNYPPALTNGYVDPSSGTSSTTFSYYLTFNDPEGAAPTVKRVWIDGSSHDMPLYSGSASSGTYRYQTILSVGSHNYYFEFSDGTSTVKLPSSGTYFGPTVSTSSSITFQANGPASDASGTIMTIDSTGYSRSQLPISFTWTSGSAHSIAASSPVSAGTTKQYIWTSWSDAGSQSHTYTVPASSQTVTANYKTQYYLTIQANPPSGGSVSPSSGWRDATSSLQIEASANSADGYSFLSWSGSGSGSYSGTVNPSSVTMNGPITETANFNKAPSAYIDSISPDPANSGSPVRFSGHGTDMDGSIVAYNWRSSIDGQLGTSASLTASPVTVGIHTIYFKVQDNSGAWSTEVYSLLTVNAASVPYGKVVFARSNEYWAGDSSEIFTMYSNGSLFQLTSNGVMDAGPRWSPDGSKIAFVRKVGSAEQIFTMNADGSDQRQITNSGLNDTFVCWSPDGSKLAFSRNLGDDQWEIFTINAGGTGETRLTSNVVADFVFDWSPDGSKLLFVRGLDNNREIYVMKSDGTGVTQLTFNNVVDWDPAWSPDGSKIAFSRYDGHDYEIFVMKADGTGVTQLTSYDLDDFSPRWSPDGSKIVFMRNSAGDYELFMMKTDGTNIAQLTAHAGFDGSPDWNRLSSTITLTPGSTSFNIGGSTTLIGSISPARSGVSVKLNYSADGGAKWISFMTVKTGGDGSFSTVWSPPYPFNYLVRASWSGDIDYSGATSDQSTVTVSGVVPSEPNLRITVRGISLSRGNTATITVTVFNSAGSNLETDLYVEIVGPSGYTHFDTTTISLPGNAQMPYDFRWYIPSNTLAGAYRVSAGLVPPRLAAYDVVNVQVK